MAIYELDGQGPELPKDGNYFIEDFSPWVHFLSKLVVGISAVLADKNHAIHRKLVAAHSERFSHSGIKWDIMLF